ncbi:hypothetical protein C6W92_07465 [Roseovarius sp. A46]|uniref:hypothetical protein n=1 Tax=Roseovarius sp. A46 TaxID=2109331 RepID=UPI0010112568|nr:hypothetical protein [Roseovarius sp. A46]RXV64676.1 hypothetical protein C6W92_07465 [Roseovarius sp. A46]
MLWIHIGMPKTGTTALQSWLHAHPGFLARHGIRYLVTGRDRGTGRARLICHNAMAVAMTRAWRSTPEAQAGAMAEECRAHADGHTILSSEMFFGRDLAPLQERYLSRIDGPVRIVAYLRRFDDFIEADYKQRAKNGLPTNGAEGFVAGRLAKIAADPEYMDLGAAFARIRAQVPRAGIVPRLYLREEMAGHNIITDFLSLFGVPPDDVPLPERAANRSLSRVTSEALGLFDERAGYDKKARRRLGRLLQASGDTRLYGNGDVLTASERAKVNDAFEARNAGFRAAHFPGRDRLFPPADASDARGRGHPDELAAFQHAVRMILRLARDA